MNLKSGISFVNVSKTILVTILGPLSLISGDGVFTPVVVGHAGICVMLILLFQPGLEVRVAANVFVWVLTAEYN